MAEGDLLDQLTRMEGVLKIWEKSRETGLIDRKKFLEAASSLTSEEFRQAANGTETELTALVAKIAARMNWVH